MQVALKYSALVAYEMQEASYKALYFSEKLINLGNKNLYSDLISAAILLAACNEMASLNVIANANCMSDEEDKNKYLTSSKDYVLKSKQLKNRILRTINSK